MKKIHTTMIVGLMAGIVLLAGCKREHGTVTLGANIDNSRDAKVYIDNLTPCWHNNDLIRVNNQTCTTSAALGSSAQITDVVESNHYRAIYPADIVGDVDISSSSTITVTLPRVQQYEVDSRGDQKVKVPMGAYSDNESLTFHNLCPLIKVVISNRMDYDFRLASIVVTAGSAYLSGNGDATVSGRTSDAIEMISSLASHDVSLAFAANGPIIGRGDRDTYVYYIVVPEFAEDDVTITVNSTNGQSATFEKRASLQHNRMAQVSLTVEDWDGQTPSDPPSIDGALPGLFSIGYYDEAEDALVQIRFSQGNLQYQASTNTWRFAEHQYDYVGVANSNIGSTYSGWIDLFGWGTSGWNSGARCYQPWAVGSSSGDFVLGGSWEISLGGDYAEADWAWHNAISNGGNAVHQWRTLGQSQWEFLLQYRTNASAKLGTGNINGVVGLIILPDSWTLPSGCTFTSGIAGWSRNVYTLSQWALMETAGAVFLPAAGYRIGNNVNNSNSNGKYWSSTTQFSHLGEYEARCLEFTSNNAVASMYTDINRNYGLSVRPVKVVE